MARGSRIALVLCLALGLSGAGALAADDDCSTDCVAGSQGDPCGDPGVPCASCSACPCAHRIPAVTAAASPAPASPELLRFLEDVSRAPPPPPLGRVFQPPRA